jgi:DNA-binding response OmpR family regulator
MESVPEEPRRTILVIDSDMNARAALVAALSRAGYDVIAATNGGLGLSMAESARPDLIITDLVAARRSGFLVIEALRTHEEYPTRIIVLTSVDSERGRQYAEDLGVDAYMTRPFLMDDLLATVKRVLEDS